MQLANYRTGGKASPSVFRCVGQDQRLRARTFLSKMKRRIHMSWEGRIWKWGEFRVQRRKGEASVVEAKDLAAGPPHPTLVNQLGALQWSGWPFHLCPKAFPMRGLV